MARPPKLLVSAWYMSLHMLSTTVIFLALLVGVKSDDPQLQGQKVLRRRSSTARMRGWDRREAPRTAQIAREPKTQNHNPCCSKCGARHKDEFPAVGVPGESPGTAPCRPARRSSSSHSTSEICVRGGARRVHMERFERLRDLLARRSRASGRIATCSRLPTDSDRA